MSRASCTAVLLPFLLVRAPAQDVDRELAALREAAPAAVVAAFDGFAAEPWPGYRPAGTPLAIWDGARTWLVRHPRPPAGYRVLDEVFAVRDGRDPQVVANSSADLGGVATATLMGDRGDRTPAASAAVLVHEAFHVFEDARLPGWTANEGVLFEYPFDDADALAARRLETHALREAWLALSSGAAADALAWGAGAAAVRADRAAALGDGAMGYERRLELREGVAQYLQYRAHDERRQPPLPADGFAAEALRDRVYASGEAWARLLDVAAPGWPARVPADGTLALDELLRGELERAGVAPRVAHGAASAAIVARARADAEAVRDGRASERRDFLAREGWRVELAARVPLALAGFDPLNVRALGDRFVLHTRMLRLAGSARVELDDARALTHGAGTHPLFEGVDRLVVTGLAERPLVAREGDVTALVAPGLGIEARGAEVAVDEEARVVRIEL